MSAAGQPHLERSDYVGPLAALYDAEKVVEDLVELGEGQTVVPADQFEFLARRALNLIHGCIEFEQRR